MNDDDGATVDDDNDYTISPIIEIVIVVFVLAAMLFACIGAVYFFGWVV